MLASQQSLLTIFLLITTASAYSFRCLERCSCDTEEEVIVCDNGIRTTLMLPASRLRGFGVIALTRNKIRMLPREELLLEKFPDLMAVDIEGNREFDCDTLSQYEKVKIMSDCGKENVTELRELTDLPGAGPDAPTATCDVGCQVKKHVAKIQQYAKRIWATLKQKVSDFDKDEFMQDVQDFFSKLARKIADAQKPKDN